MNFFASKSVEKRLEVGNILSLTGASGSGKTTLIRGLIHFLGDEFVRLIPSNTTRPFRPGKEIPGEYRRMTAERLAMYKRLGLLAWREAEIHGNTYCTLITDIRSARLSPGVSTFALVEEVIAPLITLVPVEQLTTVYVLSPQRDILVRRLRERGEKEIDRRVADCEAWDARALSHNSRIPYKFVENNKTIEWALRQLLTHIRFRVNLIRYSRGSRIHTI